VTSITKDFGISKSGFNIMYFKYENYGQEALRMQTRDKGYTKQFKHLYTDWVLGYNKSNKTTYSGKGGVTIMARKTTLEERIEIIGYLIDNDIDYNKTSTHFKVSYQQVYIWYKKYTKLGIEGLKDNRGIKNRITSYQRLNY